MWFITVFENIECDALGWFDGGARRTWGYYAERDTAVQALHENWTDMMEHYYEYAVIEQYEEGISGYVFGSRKWFKWDDERGGYFEIDEPDTVGNVCSFALG